MARSVEFNREEVLENAMNTFWQKGYSMTSIPNLVASTKLNPGSIYAAFDSKEGLFLETLEFYGKRSQATLKQVIEKADSPIIGIENFFRALINKNDEESKNGCLLVNTVLEMSSHKPNIQEQANKQLNAVELELYEALKKAQNLDLLTAEANPEIIAKYLMINIWGIRVMAKTDSLKENSDSKTAILAQILSVLDT